MNSTHPSLNANQAAAHTSLPNTKTNNVKEQNAPRGTPNQRRLRESWPYRRKSVRCQMPFSPLLCPCACAPRQQRASPRHCFAAARNVARSKPLRDVNETCAIADCVLCARAPTPKREPSFPCS
jgi:hypothetical protein